VGGGSLLPPVVGGRGDSVWISTSVGGAMADVSEFLGMGSYEEEDVEGACRKILLRF
jgi:hypothetical protein